MKNIVYKICFLFIFTIFVTFSVMAQLSLPDYAMGIPKVFLDEEESWNWSKIAEDRNWGESSNQFWRVYVDREGVKAYESPSSNSRVVKTLKFMNPEDLFYVADEQNGYLLLYTEKYQQKNLEISDAAKVLGWVSVDELLLWSTCPRTLSQIYKKAVILKDPEEVQNKKDLNIVSPEFSKSPYEMISTKRRAVDLEFYFVFKEVNGAALLLEDNKITTNLTSTKKGWMKSGLYTLWNDRLCFEPNFGEDVEGAKAAIYARERDARLFKSSGEVPANIDPLWVDKLGLERWSPKKVRFPVVNMAGGYIAQVGTISSLGSGGTSGDVGSNEKAQRIQKTLDSINAKIFEIETKLRKTNVVFVMDGTSSMKKYYQPMAKALEQAMNQNEMKGANMNFGAVVYRNYDDERESRLVETKQLTTDYMSVAQWLVSRECRSIGKSHYEAVLYGLETAIDQMKWSKDNSNFIILVGDAANAMPDAKGKTLDGIASKMAAKGINLVVFQANHIDHDAYHGFALQTQKLMFSELSKLTGKKITRSSFVLSNQLYNYQCKDNVMLVSAGFRFAEINKQESEINLRDLVEEKIVDFKLQAAENLYRLKVMIENISGEDIKPTNESNPEIITVNEKAAFDYLTGIGITPEEIELLKEKNLTLKFKGYATRTAGYNEVFTTSVFMAKSELQLLIQSLSSVNKEVSDNPRKDLQDALKKLVLSYMGEDANPDEIDVDDVMAAVSGLTSIIGRNPLSGIKIGDITNPSKVSESQIEYFMRRIEKDVTRLKKKQEDKSCYFESSNGLRYYYILIEDMPLMAD